MGSGLSKNARHGIAVEDCLFSRSLVPWLPTWGLGRVSPWRPTRKRAEPARRLVELIAGFGSCAVAYSGGVDSAVVAKAAQLALGARAVAVTGRSASLAEGELETAGHVAELIGIRHVVIDTEEFGQAEYAANDPDRCFHCKTELYTQLETLAQRLGTEP